MRNRFTLTVLGALLLTMACSQNTTVEAPELVADKATNVATNTPLKASRPNILLIVGDDVGYSDLGAYGGCLLYTSPSPRDQRGSRMPSSA